MIKQPIGNTTTFTRIMEDSAKKDSATIRTDGYDMESGIIKNYLEWQKEDIEPGSESTFFQVFDNPFLD